MRAKVNFNNATAIPHAISSDAANIGLQLTSSKNWSMLAQSEKGIEWKELNQQWTHLEPYPSGRKYRRTWIRDRGHMETDIGIIRSVFTGLGLSLLTMPKAWRVKISTTTSKELLLKLLEQHMFFITTSSMKQVDPLLRHQKTTYSKSH